VRAQTTCTDANPFDDLPDDTALQNCLNAGGTIALTADGTVGYIVAQGLTLSTNGTVLTSTSAFGFRAIIKAAPGLLAPILRVADTAANYQISNIMFDGKVFDRVHSGSCSGYRDFGSNLIVRGSGFVIDNVESRAAMCGSSMEVVGSSFEIRNSWFVFNGRSRDQAPGVAEPWSDGLTLLGCSGGNVHGNTLWDNTDIDLVVGGGPGCTITDNHIQHTGAYAFGGFVAGRFENYAGDHFRSPYTFNDVTATSNTLTFGVLVGQHPWTPQLNIFNPVVNDNSSSGAVVNLAIDGVVGGEVQRNSGSNNQGSKWRTCSIGSFNYTAADDGTTSHINGTAIQPGYTPVVWDGISSCPGN
jgi:hypothetical protein